MCVVLWKLLDRVQEPKARMQRGEQAKDEGENKKEPRCKVITPTTKQRRGDEEEKKKTRRQEATPKFP